MATERSIRDQLSTREATLIYNALQEKANGDRKAAQDLQADTKRERAGYAGPIPMVDTLLAQADMAERLAEEFI